MNNYQKNAVYIAAAISFMMVVFPPFRFAARGDQALRYDFILTVFEKGLWYISVMDLTIQLAMVWAVTALVLIALRNR